MEFEPSADQKALQDALRKLFEGEYSFESRKRILATPQGFDADVWAQLAAQGVLAAGLPADCGGFGGAAEVGVVMEQIGRHLVLEPYFSTVVLGGGLIDRLGSEAQRQSLLPAVASGGTRIAVARFDGEVPTYRLGKDGGLTLNGSITLVPDAPVSNRLILRAREDGAQGDYSSVFVLDTAAAGLHSTSYRTHDGRCAADVRLEDVFVPAEAMLGKPGDGARAAEIAEMLAIPALCAESVAILDALIEATLGYLHARTQFGQPIGRFQALQHRLADMFVMATQARSMSLLAQDRAQHPDPTVRRRALSSAKAYVDEAARFIGQNAIQLHGGMGMTAELIVSHYFKRLTLIGTAFGDRSHHIGVVSDAILAEST